jgi:alpha,alpha-trehalase
VTLTRILSSQRCVVLALFFCGWVGGSARADATATPADLFGELFTRVQLERVYPDSKTFVDAVPVRAPATVLAEYRSARARPDFDLRAFVGARFLVTPPARSAYTPELGADVRAHIDRLWTVLTRGPDSAQPYSSLLPLPDRYVVPGGRFTEVYYWDSYFTMLGLEASGRHDLSVAMLHDFAFLIDRYGHVPNGNRSYYLSRSQPPFFALMVELIAQRDGPQVYAAQRAQLEREYAFWMDGEETLAPGAAHRRLVRLPDGSLLNRYWDDRDTPREEAYLEDVRTAQSGLRPAPDVYRELRAAAESGWDFSSRWLADPRALSTIHTTDFIPPDLNSLLFALEQTIARACEVSADAACVSDMRARAAARRRAMLRYLWNARLGAFTDYDFRARRASTVLSAATLYPLFVRACDAPRAELVAATVRAKLLAAGGLATTTSHTGQQWDAPNGWAPLQWIGVTGLRSYGQPGLARSIAQRWVATNMRIYRSRGKLVEKYDLRKLAEGGGGEYPLQDGFGWTNGVLRSLLALDPSLAPADDAQRSAADGGGALTTPGSTGR